MKLVVDLSNELYHYGTKMHSGRYKWGSGDRPFQGDPLYEKRFRAATKEADKHINASLRKGSNDYVDPLKREKFKHEYVKVKMQNFGYKDGKPSEQKKDDDDKNKQSTSSKLKSGIKATTDYTNASAENIARMINKYGSKTKYTGDDISNMSDDELRRAINRVKLENEYRNMYTETEISAGKKRAADALRTFQDVNTVISGIATTALTIGELCAILNSKGRL